MKSILDNHVEAYTGDNIYDFDNNILLNWYPKRIMAQTKGASSILELGVGHGYTTNIFSKIFEKHVVLDGSPAVIENFRKTYPDCQAKIIETYFEVFSSEDKFDVIVMGFILEHVNDPVAIISQYKKFLSPHGKIFVAVPNAKVLNRRLGYSAGLLSNMEELSENDHLLGHQRYYSVETLSEDIQKAGCKVDEIEGIYLKPFTTNQMLSLQLDDTIIHALCEVGVDYPSLSCGLLAKISSL